MSFSQSLFFEMFKNVYENRSSIPKDAPAIGDLWCDEMLVFRIWDGIQWISVKDKS